ncbi:VOC family protein [Pectobacterium cacticida]|uniref:VOC family protein n=1 Tax=Pectobacterium cacticida TaxID=69221 RepID=UPI002FEF1920
MLPDDLKADLVRFERELQDFAGVLQLNLNEFHADHISLRCHQNTTAELWQAALLQSGALLSENQINGRPIRLFIMDDAISIGPWEITCVELPWPGEKYYPHEGWEHVELVLPGEAQTLCQRALAYLSDEALRTPGIKIACRSPHGEKEQLPNPTLAVTNGKVTIKFHPYDIREVVASEMAPQ